jgi:transcriptional regulator with XRE-family HTH domain
MNYGKAIKKVRTDVSKENQKDFAAGAGITQTHLSQVENNKKDPSTKLIKAIAKHARISTAVIAMYGIEEKDVAPEKLEAFKTLQPAILQMMDSLLAEK